MRNKFEFLEKYNLNKHGIYDISLGILKNSKTDFFNCEDNVIYDIASLTKIFTLNIIYNLYKDKHLDINENISKYLNCNLNITILDIIKMKYYIKLSKNLIDCQNYDEIKSVLLSANILDEKAHYNDIGFCLLGILIEKVTNKRLSDNFNDLFIQLNLNNTKALPEGYKLLGNGNTLNKPHDLKSRIMGGISGSSGIFSNVKDLLVYSNKVMNYLIFDKKFIDEIFKYNFIDNLSRNRTYAGFYKYSNVSKSYVKYDNKSLAHQGFTGSWILIDFDNKYASVMLTNSIKNNSLVKENNYFELFHKMIGDINQYLYVKN